MDGAIYRTDLSWPAIIAFEMGLRPDQFTYPNYERPGPGVEPRWHRLVYAAGLRSRSPVHAMRSRAESSSVTLRSSLNGNLMAVHALIWQRTPAIDKGFKYGDMSLWSARPHEPAAECRRRAGRRQLGLREPPWTSSPPGDRHSYTELEYETAKSRGMTRLVFLLSDEASIPVRFAKDPEHGARQAAFRRQLAQDGITLATFKTPDQLVHLIDIGLGSTAASGAAGGRPAVAFTGHRHRGLWVRSYVDRIEDYYERGSGAQTPPSGVPFHNMGVYSWDVLDAALLTASTVQQRIIAPMRDDWATVRAHSADRVAWEVLARARRRGSQGTVFDALRSLLPTAASRHCWSVSASTTRWAR